MENTKNAFLNLIFIQTCVVERKFSKTKNLDQDQEEM